MAQDALVGTVMQPLHCMMTLKSHTGSTFLMGDGAITSLSRNQGMNKRSSTEVEEVAADKIISPMIWT